MHSATFLKTTTNNTMSSIKYSTVFGFFNKKAIPDGAVPVNNFNLEKYLGRWYEIGRMDFFWEKKTLTNVYAEYSINNNNWVDVKNTGYNEGNGKWDIYEGKARFRTNDKNIAALEVSFFAGTWSGYNVIAVDNNYTYALVFGRNLDYLWLLSKTRTMPEEIRNKYLKICKEAGHAIGKINWTDQSKEIN